MIYPGLFITCSTVFSCVAFGNQLVIAGLGSSAKNCEPLWATVSSKDYGLSRFGFNSSDVVGKLLFAQGSSVVQVFELLYADGVDICVSVCLLKSIQNCGRGGVAAQFTRSNCWLREQSRDLKMECMRRAFIIAPSAAHLHIVVARVHFLHDITPDDESGWWKSPSEMHTVVGRDHSDIWKDETKWEAALWSDRCRRRPPRVIDSPIFVAGFPGFGSKTVCRTWTSSGTGTAAEPSARVFCYVY